MDITTIVGLIIGFAALIVAFLLEGGGISALYSETALLIVLGGTIGATVCSFPLDELKKVPALFRIAFQEHVHNFMDLIDEIVRLADQARREGLLSLEQNLAEINDPFIKLGLQLVIDGIEGTLLRDLLETEVYCMEERHKNGYAIFDTAGGFAPTMGIIGTVMGLVNVLSNMDDPGSLGPAIAVAFLATLYGIGTANLLWIPIGTKLKNRSKMERLYRELALEGILALQAGENPGFIRQKLRVFLDQKTRAAEVEGRGE